MALIEKLTAIADAIREKTGKGAALTLDEMPGEIAGIETGGGEDYLAQRLMGTLTEYESNAVTSIDSSAFQACTSLVSISCPHAVTINPSAFYGAKALKQVNFPALTTLLYAAFRDCASLEEFVCPNVITVTASGVGEAFSGCTAIKKIDVGGFSQLKGVSIFRSCTSLEALIIRQTDAVCALTATTAFTNSAIESGTGYIYVPSALVEEYKAATNWAAYANQFRAIEDYPDICGA